MNIAIYTRVSTREQAESGLGLEAQNRNIEKYIEVYYPESALLRYEDGGYSGTNTKRKMLQQLIKDIKSDKIDVVVIYKIDRLARNLLDYVTLLKLFEEYNVSLISICEQFDTATPIGKLIFSILASFAELESNLISQRTIDAAISMLERNEFPFRSPYGYKKENKKLVFDPIKSEVVKSIFKEFIEKQNIRNVTNEINKIFYVKLDEYTVGRILSNEVYLGKYTFQNKVYQNAAPPLLDAQMFNEVNLIRQKNLFYHDILNYIFGNRIFCSVCNQQANRTSAKKPRKRYYYYYCDCCSNYMNVEKIKALMIKPLLSLLDLLKNDKVLSKLYQERRYLVHRRNKIEHDFIFEKYDMKEFATLLEKIDKQIDKLDKKVIHYSKNIERLDSNEKVNMLVENYIKKIVLNFNEEKIESIKYK